MTRAIVRWRRVSSSMYRIASLVIERTSRSVGFGPLSRSCRFHLATRPEGRCEALAEALVEATRSLSEPRVLVPVDREVHVVLRRARPRAAPAPADRRERAHDGVVDHALAVSRTIEVRERGLVARHAASDIRILDGVEVDRLAVGMLRPRAGRLVRAGPGARRGGRLAALEGGREVAVLRHIAQRPV